MADTTTNEIFISKSKEQIILEAKRIEESLLYSSKGHFAASSFWSKFHLACGIPAVVLSAIVGCNTLAAFAKNWIVVILSLLVVALSSIMTFLNPNERASTHQNAANNYDALMNKIRIFWSIDCWTEVAEAVLTEKLKYYSELKDRLNQNSPQIPRFAYRTAKKGIENGEGLYEVDKKLYNKN